MKWLSVLAPVLSRLLDSLLSRVWPTDSTPQPEKSSPPSETIDPRDRTTIVLPAIATPPIAGIDPLPVGLPSTESITVELSLFDRAVFYDEFRDEFDLRLTRSQVTGFEAILDYWEQHHWGEQIELLAYVMATAWHESAFTMEPVREGRCKTDASSVKAVTRLYNAGDISYNYALPDRETGKSYYGRGLVQLTHRRNYAAIGRLLNLDLENEPDFLLELGVSVEAMFVGMMNGVFTTLPLRKFINKHDVDYVEARRVVNGRDQARPIARYAERFARCLREALR